MSYRETPRKKKRRKTPPRLIIELSTKDKDDLSRILPHGKTRSVFLFFIRRLVALEKDNKEKFREFIGRILTRHDLEGPVTIEPLIGSEATFDHGSSKPDNEEELPVIKRAGAAFESRENSKREEDTR